MRSVQYASREEWLQARLEGYGVGASSVATILGMSSYRTPWDLWAAHYAPETAERKASTDAARGNALEVPVLEEYAAAQGLTVVHHDNELWSHERLDWARCSPDASVMQDGKRVGLAEVKTVRSGWEWRDMPDEIRVPAEVFDLPTPAYGLQCYWQLLVSGAEWVDLVVLPMGYDTAAIAGALAEEGLQDAIRTVARALAKDLKVIRIYADKEWLQELGGRVYEWRRRHLVEGAEPDPGSSSAAGSYYASRPKREPVEVPIDDEITTLADALRKARILKKDATQVEKLASNRLKQAMQDYAAVQTPRGVVKWRKHGKGMRIDISKDWLSADNP